MKAVFTRFFSVLKANTPPSEKRYSSRKFLSLFLILFLAVGNAWGQVTLGTYNVGSFSNPGADTKFQKYSEEVELYMWRASSGHSFSAGTGAGKGIKTQDSQSGLIFYLNQKSNIAPIINFNASKNAADVTVTLYTISNEDYNKFQEGAVNDTKVTFSKTEYTTKTIVIENVKGNYSETIEDIPAGYYFIVCTGTASNTYFNQIQFLAPSTPATKYSVTYDLNGGTGAAPTQPSVAENGTFTVASAEGITPPAGKEFAGWKCSVDDATYAAGATYTMGAAAVIFSAQWQAETTKYDVTYNLNGGTGTAPTQGKVAENGTFTVASVEGITPPAGKEFAGWSDGTNTYNAGATYTMGAAAVTFTAQWKAAPTVLFHYQQSNLSANLAADTYSALGGTLTTSASMNKESASYNSSVPSDLRGGANVSKLGSSSNYIQITLATGNFAEGDTIYICGYKPYKISTTADLSGDIVNSLTTGTAKADYNIGYIVLPAGVEQNTIYLSRAEGTGTGFAAIKVIRPAQKEILSTDITLSAVTVNTEAISAENLAILKADPYKLDLTSEYAEEPTIAFTKQTVITYEDATTKTKTENIEVVAAKVDGKWQAQAEINGVTYTVTAMVPAAYTVIYKDGETELASESVKVGEQPTAEGVESKPLYTLSWKLGEEVVELSNVTGNADQEIILTAVWKPKYAATIDFTNYVQEERLTKSLADVLKDNNHNYICGGTFNKSEWGATSENAAYQGYKFKDSDVYIEFLLRSGKRATFLFGNYGSTGTIKVGAAEATDCTLSDSKYVVNATSEDVLVRFTTGGTGTVTLKSITIGEIPDISDDATLKDLKVNGTTIAGFNSATDRYYIEMPYGTQKADLPLVTAIANHDEAEVTVQDARDRDDTRATIKVTAKDGTEKYYYVYFTIALKQGVNLVKATIGDESITLVANESYIKSAIVQNEKVDGRDGGVSAGSKFQKNSYIKIEMPAGQQFKANDIVDLEVTGVGGTYKLLVYSENSTAAEKLVVNEATAPTLVVGHNKVQLNKDAQALYLVRDGSNNWNPHVKSIIVQRYMDPFIESFVIGEAEGTIDQANKTIAIEVPASADVTALEPTIVAWANGGATVTPTGPKDFTSPVTYEVSSAYAEDGTTKYTVTVTKAAASADATLKTLTINGNALTLVDGVYEYDYELPYGTTTAPTVLVEKNDANATAVVTSVSLTEAVITVTAENGATQEYVINFTVSRAISYVIYDGSVQQNIESRTGNDATGFSWSMGSNVTISGSEVPSSWNGKNYKHVIKGFKPNESTNNIITIVIPAGYLAKITLVGTTNSEGTERSLFIATSASRNKEDAMGDYIITSSDFNVQGFTTDYLQAGTYYLGSTEACRLYELSVVLYPIDYERDVRQGYYGTICLPNKGQMIGAAVYEIAYMDYKDGAPYKIYFDEILNGKMEAGVPYVFLPNEGYNQLIVTYTAIIDAPAAEVKGLYGFIGASATDEYKIPSGVGNYIIQNNQYREVLAGADARIVSNRAYITLAEVPGYNDPLYVAPAPAPGRKRIAMGTTGAQVATGVDQVQGDEVPTKMIINGQLFILRGEKMYDAQGKLVK